MVRAGIILDNRKVRTMRTFCCIGNLQKREIVLEYRMSSTDGRGNLTVTEESPGFTGQGAG